MRCGVGDEPGVMISGKLVEEEERLVHGGLLVTRGMCDDITMGTTAQRQQSAGRVTHRVIVVSTDRMNAAVQSADTATMRQALRRYSLVIALGRRT